MNDASLVRMANQIAANAPPRPPVDAAAAIAKHLRTFWAPPMRADLDRIAAADPGALDPLVHAALEQLHANA